MKRLGYLLNENTVTLELCKQSIIDASKGKRNRKSIIKIFTNINYYAKLLMKMVLNNTYIPSSYKECHIIDRGSKKHRLLKKPKFYPDQCIHHIAINLLEKRILPKMDPYCIAGIKNRGIHYGHRAIKRWLSNDRKGTKYCLKFDIKKCYDNIKPEMAFKELKNYIKDERYLKLLKTILFSCDSLPLGNYTSTWIANIILTKLDRKIRSIKGVNHYLRYVDDGIILGSNKRVLRKIINIINGVLGTMNLTMKSNYQIFPIAIRGIDILGFRYFKNYTLLRKRNLLSLTRSIRKYIKFPSINKKMKVKTRLGQLKYFNSFNLKIKIKQLLVRLTI